VDPNPDNVFPDPPTWVWDSITGTGRWIDNGWLEATDQDFEDWGLLKSDFELAAQLWKIKDITRHSVVFVKEGKILYEEYWDGYDKDTTHISFSAGKSFASTLAGIAIQENLLELHSRLRTWVPDAPDNIHDDAELIHLMSLTSEEGSEPGTEFQYPLILENSITSDDRALNRTPEMIGAATLNILNLTLREFAEEKLLDVIGIPLLPVDEFKQPEYVENCYNECPAFQAGERRCWGPGPEAGPGVLNPTTWYNQDRADMLDCVSVNMCLTTRDLARLGWLWLNKGNWDGKQLFSERFYEQATNPPFLEANSIYGFNLWLNRPGDYWETAGVESVLPPLVGEGPYIHTKPHDSFTVSGWGGQHVFVLPTHNMVIASMGDNMFPILNAQDLGYLIWLIIETAIGEPINPVRPLWTDYTQ
jgi:CubicO group peptidase (beta-lactamase class C family)